MSKKSFGEEFAGELVGKAVVLGPAVAGALLLGPVGVVVGAAATVAVIVSGGGKPPPKDQASDAAGRG